MKNIRKVYDGFFNLIENICVVFLAGMVIICAYSVFMRYVMKAAPRWGDEMALFCMVWYGLLSAAVALKEDRHIRIRLWENWLSPKANKILEVIIHVVVLAVLLWFFKWAVALTSLAGATVMTGSQLPMKYLYVAEPVAVFCMIFAAIGRIGEICGNC